MLPEFAVLLVFMSFAGSGAQAVTCAERKCEVGDEVKTSCESKHYTITSIVNTVIVLKNDGKELRIPVAEVEWIDPQTTTTRTPPSVVWPSRYPESSCGNPPANAGEGSSSRHTVNLLVVYTPLAASVAGGSGASEQRIRCATELANGIIPHR